MSHFVLIRKFRQSDEQNIRDIIKQSLFSLANDSLISTLTKEITFQLIVLTAAIMFIFVGVPITYCIAALPVVILVIYFCIYMNLTFKFFESFQEAPYQCWVAVACEPFFFSEDPQKFSYSVYSFREIMDNDIEVGTQQRKIIGTVALKKHRFAENSCWLYRLAVDTKYRHKGIAGALVNSAISWSKKRGFDAVEVSFTENQDAVRQLFLNHGFQLRQIYHKQIIGSAMSLLKYQFRLDLSRET